MKLALDLGTHMGYAHGTAPRDVCHGTWSFETKRHEDAGRRFTRFRDKLSVIKTENPSLSTIYFEEVKRHAGTTAAHIYGGLVAILKAWCVDHAVGYESVPVGTIKKYWTGLGNADKVQMIAEAVKRGFNPVDDNDADALALFHYVVCPELAAIVPQKPKRPSKRKSKNDDHKISRITAPIIATRQLAGDGDDLSGRSALSTATFIGFNRTVRDCTDTIPEAQIPAKAGR